MTLGDRMSNSAKGIYVLLISMLPLVEIRGAIPYGLSAGLSPILSAFLAVIGNILIIPILLKLMEPMLKFFSKRKYFKPWVERFYERGIRKSEKIKNGALWGLFLFVSIPMPTTGVWTGTFITLILGLDRRKSFFVMSSGVICSGFLILILSYHLFSLF